MAWRDRDQAVTCGPGNCALYHDVASRLRVRGTGAPAADNRTASANRRPAGRARNGGRGSRPRSHGRDRDFWTPAQPDFDNRAGRDHRGRVTGLAWLRGRRFHGAVRAFRHRRRCRPRTSWSGGRRGSRSKGSRRGRLGRAGTSDAAHSRVPDHSRSATRSGRRGGLDADAAAAGDRARAQRRDPAGGHRDETGERRPG